MGFELCVVRPHLDPVATTTVNRFLDDGEYIRGEAKTLQHRVDVGVSFGRFLDKP